MYTQIMNPIMRNFFLLLVILLTGCNKPEEPPLPTHAVDVSWRYERAAADFHLTDAGGKARSLSDFRGKVVVLFFGYTHCPEVCPTTLADLATALAGSYSILCLPAGGTQDHLHHQRHREPEHAGAQSDQEPWPLPQ